MNAKETLKKIAEALNIVGGEEAKVEETVEAIVEAPVEEVKEEEVKEDERVRELESQLADLKKILNSAMSAPQPEEVPEVIQEEPKGLTHSPEKEIQKKAKGIGSKGMTIQERVYKYMNN